LPASLPTGLTTVQISNTAGEVASAVVNIIDGVGTPHSFNAEVLGNAQEIQLRSLSRVPHYTVRFSGSVTPHSMQVVLSHDPDVDNGGAGRAFVVNPRGDLKNVSWADDGSNIQAMLFPAKDSKPVGMKSFKFYVAGGVTNLSVVSVEAFDSDGNPVSGVAADITSVGM